MFVKTVPGVAGTVAVMVRMTLAPLRRVGIAGQVTFLVTGLYVALSEALTKVKPAGRGS